MVQEPTSRDVMMEPRHGQMSPSAYDVFMEEQNIPIHRGLGAYDTRQLPLAPWQRMGGQGTFIELDGQQAGTERSKKRRVR